MKNDKFIVKPIVRTELNPILLAKYILAKNELHYMAHLKLQKLVYYIQAWHLAYFEQPLFEEEFEAWVHGPVCRRLWDALKDQSQLSANVQLAKEDNPKEIINEVSSALDEDQIQLINDVLEEYGPHGAYHLESLTHSEDPWRDARKGVPAEDHCSNIISKSSIKKFYKANLA